LKGKVRPILRGHVERLLQVEQAYAELSEQQAKLQFAWTEREQQVEPTDPKGLGDPCPTLSEKKEEAVSSSDTSVKQAYLPAEQVQGIVERGTFHCQRQTSLMFYEYW